MVFNDAVLCKEMVRFGYSSVFVCCISIIVTDFFFCLFFCFCSPYGAVHMIMCIAQINGKQDVSVMIIFFDI